jgi:glutamate-1-semialdehyde 2,1-aminomutase
MTALRELDRTRIGELLAREGARLRERTPESEALFRRARRTLAGGVSSSFQRHEPWPIHLVRGDGARVWDADGNEYLDFHNGFGAMIQGHAHPAVTAAITQRLSAGTHFGAPTQEAIAVAEELARRFGLDRWRFTNSGTESTMSAIRLARAYTGRDDVMKIFGAYHGHLDTVMVSLGVPYELAVEPSSLPWGEGISQATVGEVHTVHFNDAAGLERRIAELDLAGRRPACLIMEAAMTGIGVVPPEPGYLDRLREITRRHGVVLILDEVKTGLTIAPGGATERFGLEPDIVTLAKSLGAGLPSGAIGMTPELARRIEDGGVHHLGTFNGNPLSMAAARASLTEVLTPSAYARLASLNERLATGLEAAMAHLGAHAVSLGSKGCVRFGPEPVLDYPSFRQRFDPELAELCWLWSTNRGLFVTPGREHEWNLNVAHAEDSVDRHVEVFAELAEALSPRRSGSARA